MSDNCDCDACTKKRVMTTALEICRENDCSASTLEEIQALIDRDSSRGPDLAEHFRRASETPEEYRAERAAETAAWRRSEREAREAYLARKAAEAKVSA